jgi:TolA-binding protein
MLLGDICRYTGHGAQASDAYRAIRTRFPGTAEASSALFALGRIAFDQHGAYAEAGRLFSRYLQERPRGQFASEARGRLIEALLRSGNANGAQNAAKDYLRYHPAGPYTAQARKLLAE